MADDKKCELGERMDVLGRGPDGKIAAAVHGEDCTMRLLTTGGVDPSGRGRARAGLLLLGAEPGRGRIRAHPGQDADLGEGAGEGQHGGVPRGMGGRLRVEEGGRPGMNVPKCGRKEASALADDWACFAEFRREVAERSTGEDRIAWWRAFVETIDIRRAYKNRSA